MNANVPSPDRLSTHPRDAMILVWDAYGCECMSGFSLIRAHWCSFDARRQSWSWRKVLSLAPSNSNASTLGSVSLYLVLLFFRSS